MLSDAQILVGGLTAYRVKLCGEGNDSTGTVEAPNDDLVLALAIATTWPIREPARGSPTWAWSVQGHQRSLASQTL